MFKISEDLIGAYLGYYEDDYSRLLSYATGGVDLDAEAEKSWLRNRAIQNIINDSPKDRLMVYMEWNGIFGYDGRVYELATGHL